MDLLLLLPESRSIRLLRTRRRSLAQANRPCRISNPDPLFLPSRPNLRSIIQPSCNIFSAKKFMKAKPKNLVSSVKSTATTSAAASLAKGKAKREKKVFSLPGQKYDPPEEREPLRIFYESLSKQIPGSEMAEFWLMEHGMLSPEKAKRAHEKKLRKMKQIRMGTPVKPTPSYSSKPESSQRPSASKNNLQMRGRRKKWLMMMTMTMMIISY